MATVVIYPKQEGSSLLAEQSFDRSMARLRALHRHLDVEFDRAASIALGRNIIAEETGGFDSENATSLSPPFEAETRDKLILNGREDIIAILGIVTAALRRVGRVERSNRLFLLLLLVSIGFNAAVLIFVMMRPKQC